MTQPNFMEAKHYAIEQLTHHLPPTITYHTSHHTLAEVVPAVDRLIAAEQVQNRTDQLLLRTAALYHDIGYTRAHFDHESISARIAGETLPELGYSARQIAKIKEMIMATKLPQSPHDLLAEILADADLDVLGSERFFVRNEDLRREMSFIYAPVSDEEWYAQQIKFLKSHHYFTTSERALREPGKLQHLEQLERMYQQSLVVNTSSANKH